MVLIDSFIDSYVNYKQMHKVGDWDMCTFKSTMDNLMRQLVRTVACGCLDNDWLNRMYKHIEGLRDLAKWKLLMEHAEKMRESFHQDEVAW
jgi:hypothetical protein